MILPLLNFNCRTKRLSIPWHIWIKATGLLLAATGYVPKRPTRGVYVLPFRWKENSQSSNRSFPGWEKLKISGTPGKRRTRIRVTVSPTLAVHRLHQAVGDGVAQGHDLVIVQQAEQVPAALRLRVAEPRHLAPGEGGRGEGDATNVALSARGPAGALATDTGSAFPAALAGTVSDIPVPAPSGGGGGGGAEVLSQKVREETLGIPTYGSGLSGSSVPPIALKRGTTRDHSPSTRGLVRNEPLTSPAPTRPEALLKVQLMRGRRRGAESASALPSYRGACRWTRSSLPPLPWPGSVWLSVVCGRFWVRWASIFLAPHVKIHF